MYNVKKNVTKIINTLAATVREREKISACNWKQFPIEGNDKIKIRKINF